MQSKRNQSNKLMRTFIKFTTILILFSSIEAFSSGPQSVDDLSFYQDADPYDSEGEYSSLHAESSRMNPFDYETKVQRARAYMDMLAFKSPESESNFHYSASPFYSYLPDVGRDSLHGGGQASGASQDEAYYYYHYDDRLAWMKPFEFFECDAQRHWTLTFWTLYVHSSWLKHPKFHRNIADILFEFLSFLGIFILTG